jgi:adenylate kinase
MYLAVKHPAVLMYRLIFHPALPRVYAAFPITKTREIEARRREINQHRSHLHREFAVFDPLTIDDRVLINKLDARTQADNLLIEAQDRWCCDLTELGPDYASLVAEDPALFPIAVPVKEARELSLQLEQQGWSTPIDAQIRNRDFRYIDQSDIVAVYRPRWDGQHSSGVGAEKTYAGGIGRKPFVEFNLKSDMQKYVKKQGSKPFTPNISAPTFTNKEDYYHKLAELGSTQAAKRCRKWREHYKKMEAFRQSFPNAAREA